jgi:integrase
MGRRVKNTNLDTRTARLKLKPRPKPYWSAVERGLHLGYRRPGQPIGGAWIVRFYLGGEKYDEEGIGVADDYTDADGIACLDFWQAQDQARKRWKERARAGSENAPYTVADALADYLVHLEHEGKSARDAKARLDAHVLPVLGHIEMGALTADVLKQWQRAMAVAPARKRTKRGAKQAFKAVPDVDDKEGVRRRRATANRVFAVLRAALNLAYRNRKVPTADAWRSVKPFPGASSSRVRYMTEGEAERLLNACDPDFRLLVRAALETGARYSELCRLRVEDFNPDTGTLAIRESKSGKPRHIALTDDGRAFFEQACAGRAGSEVMLRRADGAPWGTSHQLRPIAEACKRAHIDPPIIFHELRHTWASLAVMNGVPLIVAAKNLGHADTRMIEKHYGHLAQSYITDEIRKGGPQFGKVETNVKPLGRP